MQITDKNDLELNVPVTADAANDSSVGDSDFNEGDLDLEDDPSDTHEDDDHKVSYMIPVPKKETPKGSSLTPISIMVLDTVGLLPSRKPPRVLSDHGSTHTLIKASIVPKKAKAVALSNKKASRPSLVQ